MRADLVAQARLDIGVARKLEERERERARGRLVADHDERVHVVDDLLRGEPRRLRVAAVRGLGIMNKYYSKTDESVMYRIAMGMCSSLLTCCRLLIIVSVLHPKHKLEYFRQHGWDHQDWINTAVEVTRKQPPVNAAPGHPGHPKVCLCLSLCDC